jgi:hypothetical protein
MFGFYNFYLKLKGIIAKVENGTWQDDPETANLTPQQIEDTRQGIRDLEIMGVHLLAKKAD